jgi:choline dehydrogenase-like flavoprotein
VFEYGRSGWLGSRILIEDLKGLETGKTLSVDICVVGAGPAGITIANEFIGSGLSVCLVESGGLSDELETQALYQGENIGHPVVMDEGRYRLFGGAATRWGGRCAVLDPIDFEARDWVRKSGWPVDLEMLRPYYERAKHASNFAEPWIPDEEVPETLGIDLPPFNSINVNPFVWRVAPGDIPSSLKNLGRPRPRFDWGRAYRDPLKADPRTHVLLHANLKALAGNEDGSRIESIMVESLTGVSMTIKAVRFVICCGGIENIRLLLNAPSNILHKLNQHDNLGRYLAQHPRGCIATLDTTPEAAARLQNLFTDFLRPSGVQYEVGFALSESAQRENGLLNASAAMYYAARPESAWKAAARLREAVTTAKPYGGMLRDGGQIVGESGSVVANTWRRIQGVPMILPNPIASLIVDLEQEPNPDSRITLSAEKDPLGMQRAKVDWRISEIERTTARYFSGFIGDVLKRLGLGQTQPSEWLNSNRPVGGDDLHGTYHFIGATRMAKDPRDGVVDENCRAHGVTNLYLAGCSVFPTGGHANPTLTILALAIRLADHLRAEVAN